MIHNVCLLFMHIFAHLWFTEVYVSRSLLLTSNFHTETIYAVLPVLERFFPIFFHDAVNIHTSHIIPFSPQAQGGSVVIPSITVDLFSGLTFIAFSSLKCKKG